MPVAKSPAARYYGRPCKTCGRTEKLVSTRSCIPCRKEKNKAWIKNNYDRYIATNRIWNAANKDRINANVRRSEHKRYGYPEPTRERPELCEICGLKNGVRVLSLDHCHKTNKFRGWLCFRCNSAIGKLGDSSAGVKRALEYLLTAESA